MAPLYGTGREVHGIVPLLQAWLAETVISASQPTIIPPTEACLYICTDTNALADGASPLGDLYYRIDDVVLDVGCLSVYQVTQVTICVIQGNIFSVDVGCVQAQFTEQSPGSGFQEWTVTLPSTLDIPNTSIDPLCLLADASYSLDPVWILAVRLPFLKGELREPGNQYAIAWYSNPDVVDIGEAFDALCDIADVPSVCEHGEASRATASPTFVERTYD